MAWTSLLLALARPGATTGAICMAGKHATSAGGCRDCPVGQFSASSNFTSEANAARIVCQPAACSSVGTAYNITAGAAVSYDSVTTLDWVGIGYVSGYAGGVLTLDGDIIFIPREANVVVKLDPATGTGTTFGDLDNGHSTSTALGRKWTNGALANNGMIYAAPYGATKVLRIDPTAETAVKLSSSISSGQNKWTDVVLAPNGYIYGTFSLVPPFLCALC
jgi:hypothetical protein